MVAPDALVATRLALHGVAEHVLAAARHGWEGRIGLRPTPQGFGTPVVTVDGVARQIRVDGVDLVVEVDGRVEREPLTTLGAAAALVGIEPGAPAGLYDVATPCEPDAPLAIDREAAALVARWFALVDEALARLAADVASEVDVDDAPLATLWPEHFDLAVTIEEVNYGGSPGDADHPDAYLYVSPWSVPEGELWNEPWGVSWPASRVRTVDDAVAALHRGRAAASR